MKTSSIAKYFLLLFFSSTIPFTYAAPPNSSRIQNAGDIVGTVTHCGSAYQGMLVYIPGTSFQARADSNGGFRLSYVQSGTYDLLFSRNGSTVGVLSGITVVAKQTNDVGSNNFCIDQDGDTYSAPMDCDDSNPSINPGATEICGDGIDNNCNALADEGCSICLDLDNDGFFGQAACGTALDCSDISAAVNPDATEICNDGIDNNCNGEENEAGAIGEITFYVDADSDGWGDISIPGTLACTAPPGYVSRGGDCNDGDSSINPDQEEICGDLTDNNCDGQVDEGCFCYDPTVCDDGIACTMDICNEVTQSCSNNLDAGSCLIDGVCYSNNQTNPDAECQVCNSYNFQLDWSNVANGTLCSIGYCSNGACIDSCSDGIQNFNETDVDCGGGTCSACSTGASCNVNDDCASNVCFVGVCL